jgi:anti-sigma factor RsiW
VKPASDEILMAYADGALAPEEQRAVERVLAADADARRVVWIFNFTREIARLAFGAPMWQPAPARHVLSIPLSDASTLASTSSAPPCAAGPAHLALQRWRLRLAGWLAAVASIGTASQRQAPAQRFGSDER